MGRVVEADRGLAAAGAGVEHDVRGADEGVILAVGEGQRDAVPDDDLPVEILLLIVDVDDAELAVADVGAAGDGADDGVLRGHREGRARGAVDLGPEGAGVVLDDAEGTARADDDASVAQALHIGDDLAAILPGSAEAMRLKAALLQKGWWSQYLEVGIGPDAEIFTKCPAMASVGTGSKIGVHPVSAWSNPEPEAVMVVNGKGRIQGATLGNDVNLRDVEGRSALLLGRAKDNNASAALGPMIRLFDAGFTLEDVRRAELSLTITGRDGFELAESGLVGAISRDPADVVSQMIGAHHQYPDGAVLYLGTPFSPAKDRGAPGMGFTHHEGDVVRISSPRLGVLVNEVDRTDECPPWRYGIGALFASLAARGLPRA